MNPPATPLPSDTSTRHSSLHSWNFRTADLPALDWELLFCSHVLHLPALHWGMWNRDDELSLHGFARAQQRFSQHVLAAIPAAARVVLDVGCGQGDHARLLAQRGCKVSALAPITNYREHLHDQAQQGIEFHQLGIEAFVPTKLYDAVLMSESCGCFPLEVGHRQSARALRNGGTLVVANMFRKDRTVHPVARHAMPDFLDSAHRHGFTVRQRIDITEAILPTLHFFRTMHQRHIAPALTLGEVYLQARRHARPFTWGIVAALTRSWRQRMRAQIESYISQLDPEAFHMRATYEIVVLEYSRDSAANT